MKGIPNSSTPRGASDQSTRLMFVIFAEGGLMPKTSASISRASKHTSMTSPGKVFVWQYAFSESFVDGVDEVTLDSFKRSVSSEQATPLGRQEIVGVLKEIRTEY